MPLVSTLVDYLVVEKLVKPGYYVGVLFSQGPVFFKVLSREILEYTYTVSNVPSRTVTNEWIEPVDDMNRRILEPEQDKYVLQVMFGIRPALMRVYLQFPPRVDRWSLRGTRKPGGPTGYVDGFMSPYDNPSIRSELWCWKDLYPAFMLYNDHDETMNAILKFYVAKIKYKIIRDRDTIKAFIEDKRRCHKWSFLEPYDIPEWLMELVGAEVIEYGKSLWEER